VSRSIKLITGIPRSGTTLCCKLLNHRADVVALHEPINPGAMPQSFTTKDALHSISEQIMQFDSAIEQGLPFSHGDKGGLTIDNPVGLNTENGVRQVVAKRGEVQLPARDKNSYELIIKQNALFTALMPELALLYPMVCIVRNPVDVLLSWLTVDLPVNRGHIPAGERFDNILKTDLLEPDCLKRQIIIYQWFIQAFLKSGLPIVRYEDIVSSDGAILEHTLGWQVTERAALSTQEREFEKHTLLTLEKAKNHLLNLDCGDIYTKTDIKLALHVQGL
jgi:hypothetical protein